MADNTTPTPGTFGGIVTGPLKRRAVAKLQEALVLCAEARGLILEADIDVAWDGMRDVSSAVLSATVDVSHGLKQAMVGLGKLP